MALQLSFTFQERMTFIIVVLVLAVISIIFVLIFKSRRGRDRDSQITITQSRLGQNQLLEDDEPARPKEPPVVQPARSVRSEPASPKTRSSRTRRSQTFEIPAMFATIDLETTGFSAGMDEIIEIGAIKCAGLDGDVLEFATLVRPNHPIPAGITATTGITQEMVDQDGVPLVESIEKLQSFLSCMPFIGYQVGFDVRFLKCASDQHKLGFSNRYLDVMEMARDAYPHLPSHKLEDIARMLNLSNDNAHRALADCRRTLAVFRHVVTKVDGKKYAWNDPCELPIIEANQPRSNKYEQVLNHMGTRYPSQHGNSSGHLYGENVVFTGDLSIPRVKAIEMAVAAGCDVNPNVCRKTTIVVSGFRDPSLYNNKMKSGKLLKAEELIEEGCPLRILTESEFLKLLRAASPN